VEQEIERLRRELEQTRAELLAALRENVKLKARLDAQQAAKDLESARADAAASRKAARKALEDLLNDQKDRASQLARIEAARALRRYLEADTAQPNKKSPVPGKTPSATSPDGKLTASARDQVITILDAQTGKEIASLRGHTATVSALDFSPDGKMLASGSLDKTVALWELGTFQLLRKLTLPSAVNDVCFRADGKMIAVRESDGTERKIDAATGKEVSVSKK
jgi:hypothetical protein